MAAPDLALALTGASGVQYGIRLLECLVSAGVPVHLMLSRPAQVVLGLETDLSVPGRPAEIGRYFSERFQAEPGQIRCYGPEQWTAPVASGSAVPRAMIVCPCSTATLSAVGLHSNTKNLLNLIVLISILFPAMNVLRWDWNLYVKLRTGWPTQPDTSLTQ
jgi:3-polyprenyl-4-hydroxybenzoate decarboxylase